MREEYIKRREKFVNSLPEDSIAVVFSGNEIRRTSDESYDFAPDYNLYYLTGIKQPTTFLLFVKSSLEVKEYIFIQKYDALKEVWTGIRLKSQEVKEITGIENVLFEENFYDVLAKSVEELSINGKVKVWFDLETAANFGDTETFVSIADYQKQIKEKYNVEICDSSSIFKHLRMVKSPREIEKICYAITNTNRGLKAILKALQPGKYEYDMANEFLYNIRKEYNAKLAFNTIAAGGKNAVILHYPNPADIMNGGDLLLLDLGSDYEEYKADISRTYPINGKYNKLQKQIYEIVLNCNKHIIAMIKPGLKIADLQNETRKFFAEELKKLKLIEKDDEVMKYYYHNVSHHLGLDTHDISLRELPLEEGNVITVEPGLYIKEYGIGIRIEDDVLVTKDGSKCLSKEIAKEPDEIEKLMK